MTVDVTDMLSSGESIAASDIDCGAAGDGDNAIVPADGSIACTYDVTDIAGVAAGDNGTNTATATFSADAKVAVSDDDGYTFALASETDECIDLSDTLVRRPRHRLCRCRPGRLHDRVHVRDRGREGAASTTSPNVASFETSDQDGEDDDSGSADHRTSSVTVDCARGCSLTQGYWKTHSAFGPRSDGRGLDGPADVDGDGVHGRAGSRPSSNPTRRGTRSSGPTPQATPTTTWPSSTWLRS